ncbi:transposase [uncultured Salegentibacter sp.]|uniref:transposase n=1 Tax=uncultured Salegentibacter sp. TaxID=259320 RepID=UPI00338F0E55
MVWFPGLGNKTGFLPIVFIDECSNFVEARHFCSYTRITLTLRSSGSSLRGLTGSDNIL